jgi:ParB-like chromosome segregation protein Spo0J
MKATTVKISEVKANPNNPRIIKDDKFQKLVKSIKEFPEMLNIRPIVVNADMVVLGGNMRLKACKEAGLKELPIIKADDLTEEQQKQFIIKDNVGYGEWDWETLANQWDVDNLNEWGLDLPDYKHEEEKELSDLSEKLKSEFKIEIICKDETEQEQTYNKLIEQNYECRLLTL